MAGQGFIPNEPQERRDAEQPREEPREERERPMSARRDLTPRARVHEPHRTMRRLPEESNDE